MFKFSKATVTWKGLSLRLFKFRLTQLVYTRENLITCKKTEQLWEVLSGEFHSWWTSQRQRNFLIVHWQSTYVPGHPDTPASADCSGILPPEKVCPTVLRAFCQSSLVLGRAGVLCTPQSTSTFILGVPCQLRQQRRKLPPFLQRNYSFFFFFNLGTVCVLGHPLIIKAGLLFKLQPCGL